MHARQNDEGRFAPEFDDSVSEQAECTTVLYCIGQKVDWRELLAGTAVEFNPNGTVKADPVTYQTAEKDIFVGGDAYTGQKFAIDAIAAGKEGAISLHRFVQHATLTVGRNRRQFIELDKENALIPVNYDTTPRQRIGYNEALRRTFSDERVAFTEEQIKRRPRAALAAARASSTRTSASAAASARRSARSTPSTCTARDRSAARCTPVRTR